MNGAEFLHDVGMYYLTLAYYWLRKGNYTDCPYFVDNTRARVFLFSISLTPRLWDQPHYRSGTFQNDLVKNLRNVAIPGSCIPLSWLCYNKLSFYVFILFFYPIICFIAALNIGFPSVQKVLSSFRTQLICPEDWFSLWRINCSLATYHSLITNDIGYDMEDKWKMLVKAKELNIPVSPWLDVKEIVIKDKNEEGGMGIYLFKNAVHGGDFIIQEKLYNSSIISSLLPSDAPLSTFRIITASTLDLQEDSEINKKENDKIKSLSCVFRAGFTKAKTDHESILFDVNMSTGEILKGTTNNHWYCLGFNNLFRTSWLSSHTILNHPDTFLPVSGHRIPEIEKMVQLCNNAHKKLLPNVPLAGWDVALTTKGTLLLEVNLSCNFFRGTFDSEFYFLFIHRHFLELEKKNRKSL